MHMFAVCFANLGVALCSVKLVTLKEQMSGEFPSFTNHAGHEIWTKRREAMPRKNCKLYQHYLRISKTDVAVFISSEHLVRYVEEGKSWNSEAPSSVDSNTSKIDEIEDPYKEIWQQHWVLHGLKSALDRLQHWSKTGISHSFGVRWGWINTWWKDNFVRHTLKQLFATWSDLDREKNSWKRGSDEVQWRRRWWWCKR